MVCGRQFGKSLLGLAELLGLYPGAQRGALHQPGGKLWFVTRTARHAKESYRQAKVALAPLLVYHNDTDLELVLQNECRLEFRSADRPDLLRGFTLDGLVFDEITLVPARLWYEVLSPLVAARKGWVLFMGTPRGKGNWVYPLWLNGQKPSPLWGSWSGPCTDNPLISKEELAVWRATCPESYFRQEYLGEWLDDACSFFPGLDKAYRDYKLPTGPRAGCAYYHGGDLAKHEDYTAVSLLERDAEFGELHRLIHYMQWRRLPWGETRGRIVGATRHWGSRLLLDATRGSVGDPLIEDFQKDLGASRVAGFGFTSGSKEALLKGLEVGLESSRLVLPGTPERPAFPELDLELRGYGWVPGKNGVMRPGPRDGGTDDAVMSLGLAWHCATANPVGLTDIGALLKAAHAVESIFAAGLRPGSFT